MKNKKGNNCYKEMLKQCKTLQERLHEIQKQVIDLQETYQNDAELREGCPDEIAGDRAVSDLAREICIESLLDIEPKGDA